MTDKASEAKKRIVLIFVLLLLGSLVYMQGCSTLQDLTRSIEKPKLSVTDVQVTGFDFTGLNLAFDVTVDNPNPLTVQMLAYDYGLDINDQTLVSGRQEDPARIEASGESVIQVPVRLGYREVYRAVENLLKSSEAAYAFKSTVTFDLPGLGRTEVPVRREGSIPVLRMPSIRFTGLQINELSLSSASLGLTFEFDNPNGIAFDIQELDYTLNIDGTRWAEGQALEGITLTENGTTRLEVPITLNMSQMSFSAYRLLTGSETVDYDFDGSLSLDALHPMLGETKLQLKRHGQLSINN